MTSADLASIVKDYATSIGVALAAFFGWRSSQLSARNVKVSEGNSERLEAVKKSTDGVVEKLEKAAEAAGAAKGHAEGVAQATAVGEAKAAGLKQGQEEGK